MSTKTDHYQLNQWEPSDPFLRTDFNEDNAKLDAALTALAGRNELVIGTYTGNGAANRNIDLGFTPKAVIVCDSSGLTRNSSAAWGGVALPDIPATYTYSSNTVPVVSLTDNGFTVYYKSFGGTNWVGSNGSGTTLIYFALR